MGGVIYDIEKAKARDDLMAELPQALCDDNRKMMSRIVQQACSEVTGDDKNCIVR